MTDTCEATAGGLLRVLSGTFVLTYKMTQLCWASDPSLSEALGDLILDGQRKLQGLNCRTARRIGELGTAIPFDIAMFAGLASIDTGEPPRDQAARLAQIAGDHRQLALDIETLLVTLDLQDDPVSLSLLLELQDSHKNCAELVQQLADRRSAILH